MQFLSVLYLPFVRSQHLWGGMLVFTSSFRALSVHKLVWSVNPFVIDRHMAVPEHSCFQQTGNDFIRGLGASFQSLGLYIAFQCKTHLYASNCFYAAILAYKQSRQLMYASGAIICPRLGEYTALEWPLCVSTHGT